MRALAQALKSRRGTRMSGFHIHLEEERSAAGLFAKSRHPFGGFPIRHAVIGETTGRQDRRILDIGSKYSVYLLKEGLKELKNFHFSFVKLVPLWFSLLLAISL